VAADGEIIAVNVTVCPAPGGLTLEEMVVEVPALFTTSIAGGELPVAKPPPPP
jgi:hypothetical protein